MIEALAFEEEPPEFSEKDDLTLPDNEGMLQEAEKELVAFRVDSSRTSFHLTARMINKLGGLAVTANPGGGC